MGFDFTLGWKFIIELLVLDLVSSAMFIATALIVMKFYFEMSYQKQIKIMNSEAKFKEMIREQLESTKSRYSGSTDDSRWMGKGD